MLTGVASLTLLATVLNSAGPARLALELSEQNLARPETCGEGEQDCTHEGCEDVYWSESWDVGRVFLLDWLMLKWSSGTFLKEWFLTSCCQTRSARVFFLSSPYRVLCMMIGIQGWGRYDCVWSLKWTHINVQMWVQVSIGKYMKQFYNQSPVG